MESCGDENPPQEIRPGRFHHFGPNRDQRERPPRYRHLHSHLVSKTRKDKVAHK